MLIVFAFLLAVGQGVLPSSFDTRQQRAVRVAASPYTGMPVVVAVEPSTSARGFVDRFATVLRSAGLVVTVRATDASDLRECPATPGLSVRYGPLRSGAVNAIAEALITSGVLQNSLSGCRVQQEDELTFVLRSVV